MGDSMKRAAVILAILSLGILSFTVGAAAQTSGQPAKQNPPAAGQAAPAQGAATAPAAKRPPQAKTQPEFDAWKLAVASADVAALEKAADDFATKFPDSELRVLIYQNAMRLYQNANNAEKTEAMGRKVLSLDADNPEALVIVSEVIAERTHDSDIDKDQRFGEAVTMANKAMQTIDTDISVPAGTPQEKIDAYKAGLRSNAYSILAPSISRRRITRARRRTCRSRSTRTRAARWPWTFSVWRWRSINRENIRRRLRWTTA